MNKQLCFDPASEEDFKKQELNRKKEENNQLCYDPSSEEDYNKIQKNLKDKEVKENEKKYEDKEK